MVAVENGTWYSYDYSIECRDGIQSSTVLTFVPYCITTSVGESAVALRTYDGHLPNVARSPPYFIHYLDFQEDSLGLRRLQAREGMIHCLVIVGTRYIIRTLRSYDLLLLCKICVVPQTLIESHSVCCAADSSVCWRRTAGKFLAHWRTRLTRFVLSK